MIRNTTAQRVYPPNVPPYTTSTPSLQTCDNIRVVDGGRMGRSLNSAALFTGTSEASSLAQ